MDKEHEKHLAELLDEIVSRTASKYEGGVIEHGGKLWEKDGLLDEAISEAVDMLVYLLTLKQQLEGKPNGTRTKP